MSTRRFEDDPRLTAYALGELEPAEARQVEALLIEDAEARACVEEIRATALRLTEALRNEATGVAGPGTTGSAAHALAASGSRALGTWTEPGPLKIDFQPRRRSWIPVLAAAASLAVVGLVGWGLLMRDQGGPLDSVAVNTAIPGTPDAVVAEREVFEKGGGEMLQKGGGLGGAGVQTAEALDDDQRQQVVAQLKTDTMRAVNEKNFGEALNYADQMLNLDPKNEFAQAAQPLLQERVLLTMQNAQYGYQNQQQAPAAEMGQQTLAEGAAASQPVPMRADDEASRGRRAEGDVQDKLGMTREAQEQAALNPKSASKDGAAAAKPAETAPVDAAGQRGAAPRPAAEPAQAPGLPQQQQTQSGIAAGAGEETARTFAGGGGMGRGGLGDAERAEAFTQGATLRTGESGNLELRGRYRDDFNTEQYDRVVDNEFKRVLDQPLSTFGVDVDTASYANTRRFLNGGQLPPPDAVRIEEMVNYFDYNYTPPSTESEHPFAASVAVSEAPWNPANRLVRIGIKGKEVPVAERPATNLVFLLDVSGSMDEPTKLPLVKQSMRMLAEQLDERDRVAIVVYAGSSGLVLPSTSGAQRDHITGALDRLSAGGSTNGGEGIQLAYQVARQNFIKGGINRVILCTDGDFNIGVTDRGQLTRLIEQEAKAKDGVYLSILGFGMGNLKDATMEELTNKGEGNYGYIDTEHEARKLLVEQMQGTLQAIAKDVKIQVEFNPAEVGAYRLIGYENRILAAQDFNDDTKDAGDIGAGHEVTALYEVVPVEAQQKSNEEEITRLGAVLRKYEELQTLAGPTPDGRLPHEVEVAALRGQMEALQKSQPAPEVDELRYQQKPAMKAEAASGDLLVVKLRYKAPDEAKEQGTSTLIEFPVKDEPKAFREMDQDFQFAASVAGFGMLLRDSPYKGTLTWANLNEMTTWIEVFRAVKAQQQPEPDPRLKEQMLRLPQLEQRGDLERRIEFRDLVNKATVLSGQQAPQP